MSTFGSGLHVTIFCLSDGESRSALQGGDQKPLDSAKQKASPLVVDEEGQFGAVRSGLSSIYMIRMGLRLVQMRGKKLQADDVMQRMPRSDLFFHLLFANSVQMDPDARAPASTDDRRKFPLLRFP